MCDKVHFEELEGRVNKLEKEFAVHNAISTEQIKTLFKSTKILLWVSILYTGTLLLTVIYGAIGERGFNHVTDTAKDLTVKP